MLNNLKAEMVRHGVKAKDISDLLHVRLATVYDKLNGHYEFTFNEALKIKHNFFPNYDLEYLFAKNNQQFKEKFKEKQGQST